MSEKLVIVETTEELGVHQDFIRVHFRIVSGKQSVKLMRDCKDYKNADEVINQMKQLFHDHEFKFIGRG